MIGVLLTGHKSITNMLSTALRMLLAEPGRWSWLCQHQADIAATVEEALRYDSPVHMFYRTAVRDAEIGGARIPAGEFVLIVYGSANRDPQVFARADEFDVARERHRHFAFGRGPHFCIGAPLARLEGRVALEVLTTRLPRLRAVPGQRFQYLPNRMFRGLTGLEVEWSPR
jgi:cytochrome P450